jgi:type I restriction enzyme S subunit
MRYNWPTKKLGEVCENYFSGIWGEEPVKEGNTFVIRVSDIKEGGIIDYSEVPIRWVDPQKLKKIQLQEGDLLVVKSSGSKTRIISGRTAIFENKPSIVFCPSNFLLTLRPNKEKVLPKWLWLYLNGGEAKKFVEKIIGATTYPNIRPADYLNLEIPLPPLEIQKRIVARIEELFEKIDKAKQLREKAIEETEKIFQSALQEIFDKAEKKWGLVKVLDISERRPQYGYTASAVDSMKGPKFLRITDIQNGKVDWNKVPYCQCSDKDFEKYKLEKDDILFARTGATTGKTYLVKECPSKAVFASYLIRLRCRKEKVLPEYMCIFFQSPQYWSQIIPYGGAQPNMNAQLLSKIQLPLPPLSEQKKIVTYLDDLREKIKKLKQLQQKQLEELTELKNSILEKAFKGELI